MTTETTEILPPESKVKSTLKTAGWIFAGLFFLVFFTLIKLPEDKIKALIDAEISNVLSQKGISYSAQSGSISYFLGLSYRLKGITLTFAPPAPPAHIEFIKVSPSLLSLLFKKIAGSISIENAGGSLNADFSFKNSDGSIYFKSNKFDLGKSGLFPLLVNLQGSALADGKGSLDGDFSVPSTLNGDINLQLSKLILDAQPISGFPIPKVQISEAHFDLEIGRGKMVFKTFQVGKTGNTVDDIRGSVTGDILLTKKWDSSTLNLKAKFNLSESILKSVVLLDAILGVGKQADGSYGFSITGPISSPVPNAL